MNITENQTRVIIAALIEGGITEDEANASFSELESLVETAGGTVVGIVSQYNRTPEPRTLIGEGKAEELSQLCETEEAELVVFDNELSPSQIRNLENITGAKVFDRSMLILEIFNLHATTNEGKLQVELAQLKYTLPRLTGKGVELSRLGGGGGMGARRGAGETKLEIDRRRARERMSMLRRELEDVHKNRLEQRQARDRSGLPLVALVGYTNAGKSTLLNKLTGAGVLVEDKLFATLDPTTRKYTLDDGIDILLTDTVGFISNLPHHLVEAFASTLDEVRYADILLHVVDASNPDFYRHMQVCEELFTKLEAGNTPRVIALNKADVSTHIPEIAGGVPISALSGDGLDELKAALVGKITASHRLMEVLIPYDRGDIVEKIHNDTIVLDTEYRGDGVFVRLRCDEVWRGRLERYML